MTYIQKLIIKCLTSNGPTWITLLINDIQSLNPQLKTIEVAREINSLYKQGVLVLNDSMCLEIKP